LTSDPLLAIEKTELVHTIRQQQAQLEKLRQENEVLRQEIEKLKSKGEPPRKKSIQEASRNKRGKPPHLWGRKKGHPGSWRPVPEHIDREVEQRLESCPECRNPLGPAQDYEEHLQEDIIPARVEVTRYRHYRYWCGHCREHVLAPHAPDEIPYGKIGPKALTVMVLLKYYYALPGNKIKAVLEGLCGLKVSEGGISQALQRLGYYLEVETRVILAKVRAAAVKHADETGWNINGANHWLWVFLNEMWVYYWIDRSRAAKIPKAILGKKPPGILVTDFYEPYRSMGMEHQTCQLHLRREMDDCRSESAPKDADFDKPYKRLKRILDDANRLRDQRQNLPPLAYKRRVRLIEERLRDFACEPYRDKSWKRLSKRLLRHEGSMFTYLKKEGVPNHNNLAERLIKPQVIIRNRSFQNRTDRGAKAHAILSSLTYTLIQQKRNPLMEIVTAYPQHRAHALTDLPPTSRIFASGSPNH
jgi:transposase